MSLDWSIEACRDWQELVGEEHQHENVITQSLVFMTIGVGLGEITEENAQEFWMRCRLYETLSGTIMHANGTPYHFTIADIRRRVGLKTNVFPNKSRAAWSKDLVNDFMEDLAREWKRAENAEATPGS